MLHSVSINETVFKWIL